MTPRDFVFWLQGYFEISKGVSDDISMTEEQVKIIQNHLNLVFKHEIDSTDTSHKLNESFKQSKSQNTNQDYLVC